jgi:O-antigen ligase
MGLQKVSAWALKILIFLSLLTPVLVSKDLLFPFVTTKAFYFRVIIELGLPFYIYLLLTRKDLRPDLKQPLNFSVLSFLAINLVSAFFGVNLIKSLWGNFERMGGVFYLAHLTLLYFYLLAMAKISANWLAGFLKTAINLSVGLVCYGMLVRFLAEYEKLVPLTEYLRKISLDFLIVPDPSLPVRSSITFGNPIYVGSFLILPFFLSIFFALQAEGLKAKVWWWLTAFVEILGIYYSGTRGAMVGLVLGSFISALVYLFFEKRHKNQITMSIIISVFLAGGFALFAVGNSLPHNLNFSRLIKLNDSNSQARLIQWKVALRGYVDRPILGTGPENYYVISSMYHNPEIYQYDRSWFDKPHNFLLEILVTTGIFGFAAYLGIIFFSAYGLFLAYKNEILGLPEFCVLLAGVLVYQIQNLFVFDNIAASMMFFVYLGFASFLFPKTKVVQSAKKNLMAFEPWQAWVFGASLIAVFYVIYVGNISSAKASKNTNYGYAYSSVDPQMAQDYFNQAITSPFNFDKGETAMKYAEFASNIVNSNAKPELIKTVLNNSANLLEQITQSQAGNYPVYWQKLAQIYLIESFYNKTQVNPQAEEALKKAIELSPNRVEAKTYYAEMKLWQGRVGEAVEMFKEVSEIDPSNSDVIWELAVAENSAGQTQSALKRVADLLEQKKEPRSFQFIAWMIDYYKKTNNAASLFALYEHAANLGLLDITAYKDLLQLYVNTKQVEKAQSLAEYLIKQNPKFAPEVQKILKP